MNKMFQIILLTGSTVFFIFIIEMIRNRRLDLKYALIWLGASCSFILLSVFPSLAGLVSGMLRIKEPVNALFLLVLFFLITIIFALTVALSKMSNKVSNLTQELGLLKLRIENPMQTRGDSD